MPSPKEGEGVKLPPHDRQQMVEGDLDESTTFEWSAKASISLLKFPLYIGSYLSVAWKRLKGNVLQNGGEALSAAGLLGGRLTKWYQNFKSTGSRLKVLLTILLTLLGAVASVIEISNYMAQRRSIENVENRPPGIRGHKRLLQIALVMNGDLSYTRDIRMGFITELEAGLANSDFVPLVETGVGVSEEDADETNKKVFQDVISKLPGARADYLVTIGTGVSRFAHQEYLGKIPLIFIGVTDPVASGLVPSYEPDHRRRAVAGVNYGLSHIEKLKLFAKYFPGNKFGYVYHPAYNQDVVVKNMLAEKIADMDGVEIVFIEVYEPRLTAEQEQQADIFFGHYYVSKEQNSFLLEAHKPFIGGTNPDNLKRGSMMIIGNDDDKNLGRTATRNILLPNLLEGVPLCEIPVQRYEKTRVGLNLPVFRRYDIAVPSELRKSAGIIIGE